MDKAAETYNRNAMKDNPAGSFMHEQAKKKLVEAGLYKAEAPTPDAAAQAEGLKTMPALNLEGDTATSAGYRERSGRDKPTADYLKNRREGEIAKATVLDNMNNTDLGAMGRANVAKINESRASRSPEVEDQELMDSAKTGAADSVAVQIQKLEALPDSPAKQRKLGILRQKLGVGK